MNIDDELIEKMVGKFLNWRLPEDFTPDAGIEFYTSPSRYPGSPHWPIGTNLLTADQAREMVKHMLSD